MTLSLRTWRYGSRASALRPNDPVGILTMMALREAHVDEEPPVGTGSIEERHDRTAQDGTAAVAQSHHKEMLNSEGPYRRPDVQRRREGADGQRDLGGTPSHQHPCACSSPRHLKHPVGRAPSAGTAAAE